VTVRRAHADRPCLAILFLASQPEDAAGSEELKSHLNLSACCYLNCARKGKRKETFLINSNTCPQMFQDRVLLHVWLLRVTWTALPPLVVLLVSSLLPLLLLPQR